MVEWLLELSDEEVAARLGELKRDLARWCRQDDAGRSLGVGGATDSAEWGVRISDSLFALGLSPALIDRVWLLLLTDLRERGMLPEREEESPALDQEGSAVARELVPCPPLPQRAETTAQLSDHLAELLKALNHLQVPRAVVGGVLELLQHGLREPTED